ncbi:MAG: hypothetical protein RL033_7012, partial [Pseudomonadota bacterium]
MPQYRGRGEEVFSSRLGLDDPVQGLGQRAELGCGGE